MVKTIRYILILLFLITFSGCSLTQDKIKETLQTNSAELIGHDQKRLQKLLVSFKSKLDKRNPKNFNKNNERKIYSSIKDFNKKLYLSYEGKTLKEYKEYLDFAFTQKPLSNRNDYLILGLCYMISDAYVTDSFHNITALQYDKEKLSKLYQNLQVLRWKIKVDKDLDNNYLFLTWQNNWQIELANKLKADKNFSYEDIESLEFIKSKKESLFSHSNFSFEVILTQMIDSVENSLKALGEEPTDLGISTVKFFIFL